jgi:hypothetical protein
VKPAFDVPNIHQSLKQRFQAGEITLEEVAREYHRSGHTNSVDLDYTKRQMES